MDLRSVLLDIHAVLDSAAIDHALIGGLVLAAHGGARATVGVDSLADGDRAADVDRVLVARDYETLHRGADVGNYASADPARGRLDFLFVRRPKGREILARAARHDVLGTSVRVVDASDLIGLKVQASANDPARARQDLADIEKLLRNSKVDFGRVREYFRLFDREAELDALLASIEEWKR